MILSILICAMPSRSAMLECLLSSLSCQKTEDIEILTDDTTFVSTGKKRNGLLKKASGKYIVFIDDDDDVSDNYISLILSAIKDNQGVDCIGISGIITTDGFNEKQWHISKDFKTWHEKEGVYYRTPNHISPVKKDLAIKAGFPDKYIGEDYDYSMRLLPLLKTEVRIKENIYHYKYISK